MTSRWLDAVEKLPIATDRPIVGYAAAVLACVLGLGLRYLVGAPLGHGYPFITFFPIVLIVAFLFGLAPGVLAGALSWLTVRYFILQPDHSFQLNTAAVVSLLLYGLIVAVQLAVIHFFQQANRALRRQRELSQRRSEQREVMFQELQHRMSNKLQIIASLLSLQRRMVADPLAKKALDDAALRIGLIGRISRALHDPDRGGLVVTAFLEKIGQDIISASGARDVILRVKAEPAVTFSDGAGVPIALIVCETISNALEHGFQSKGQGTITIAVQQPEPKEMVVTIQDDGVGIDPNFDAQEAESLGMRIATILSRQLEGSYVVRPAPQGGTLAELRIAV